MIRSSDPIFRSRSVRIASSGARGSTGAQASSISQLKACFQPKLSKIPALQEGIASPSRLLFALPASPSLLRSSPASFSTLGAELDYILVLCSRKSREKLVSPARSPQKLSFDHSRSRAATQGSIHRRPAPVGTLNPRLPRPRSPSPSSRRRTD